MADSAAPDRISYSMGRKLNMGNYESCDFHISYSTDVGEGETRKEALARAVKLVERSVTEKEQELRRG